MQWLYLGLLGLWIAAVTWAAMSVGRIREELAELRTRVNVNDEVITLHSEELDELQRGKVAQAERRARDVAAEQADVQSVRRADLVYPDDGGQEHAGE
jgi:hypothetical protein